MPKWSDMEGKKIVDIKSGMVIGNAQDILINKSDKRLYLKIKGNGLFSKQKIVSLSDILKVSVSCIMTNFKECKNKKDKSLISFQKNIEKKAVICEKGSHIGNISDIIFNVELAKMPEFEISDGIVQDILEGKKRVKLESVKLSNDDFLKLYGSTTDKFKKTCQY